MAKSITYSSTRGSQKSLSFRHAVMTGLAHDRGLFVPDSFPTVSPAELEAWRGLSYADLAAEVIGKYVREDEVPGDVLRDIVKRSCGAFRTEEVTPVVKVDGHYVLVSGFDWNEVNGLLDLGISIMNFEDEYVHNILKQMLMMPAIPGAIPRTNLRLQRRSSPNARQFLRILPLHWIQRRSPRRHGCHLRRYRIRRHLRPAREEGGGLHHSLSRGTCQ